MFVTLLHVFNLGLYDYELYWFYGNHVCIFIVLFLFTIFISININIIVCLRFVENKRVYD